MSPLEEVQAYQRQTTGSENFYRHGLYRRLVYTDGVHLMAEKLRAYWLIDAVASHLLTNAALRQEWFQVWTLTLKQPAGATLVATDGDKGDGPRELVRQEIEFTDFPVSFTLWCEHGGEGYVLMLPEER